VSQSVAAAGAIKRDVRSSDSRSPQFLRCACRPFAGWHGDLYSSATLACRRKVGGLAWRDETGGNSRGT